MAFTILSESFCMVVMDSIIVQRSQAAGTQAVASSYQALCWGAQAAGKLPAAWISGALAETDGGEQGSHSWEQLWALVLTRAQVLWTAVNDKAIFLPALFLFAGGGDPDGVSSLFYFMTNELKFSHEFMGRMQMLEGLTQLVGVILFNRYFKAMALWKLFLGTLAAGVAVNLTMMLLITGANRALMLPDALFAIVDDAVMAGIARVAMLPLLVLAARICPPGIEATLFGLLMSLRIGSHIVAKAWGSALTRRYGVTSTDFANFSALWLLCTLLHLLPLRLLPSLAKRDLDDDAVASSERRHVVDAESPDPGTATPAFASAKQLTKPKAHASPAVSQNLDEALDDDGVKLIGVTAIPSAALYEGTTKHSPRYRVSATAREYAEDL
ncbi:hypothetical protein WJX72_011339 [[Myrmecia] bisecta]|uniref:Uncharacterized protein n=1 Tax=[Myrmecia] bisecta TaxID=41462 RepID=A0AAW1R988_9CHLO